MAIEIVSFPVKNGGAFRSYVSLQEGTTRILSAGTFYVTLMGDEHPFLREDMNQVFDMFWPWPDMKCRLHDQEMQTSNQQDISTTNVTVWKN